MFLVTEYIPMYRNTIAIEPTISPENTIHAYKPKVKK